MPVPRSSSRPMSFRFTRAAVAAGVLLACAGAPVALGQPSEAEPAQPAEVMAAEPDVLFSGSLWGKAKAEIEGSYRIERDESGTSIVFSKDFKTKKPPLDLRIVLSPLGAPDHPEPRGVKEATGKTALNGGRVVAHLQKVQGEQRYRLPDGIDFDDYRSVLLHCEEYKVLWGGAPLTEGEVLHRGESDDWDKKSNRVRGGYEIARDEEGLVLRLGPDFSTKKGPDLKPVLSPIPAGTVRGETALHGGVVLSPLDSHKGAQEFRIPEGTDLSRFRSLLIHCEQYTKLWAAAPIE